MKKITLLAALFAGFAMNAQNVIFYDDFNDEDVSDWTLYDEDGDGNQWADLFQVEDNTGNPITPVSIISRSWQGFPLTPDNWIVSPAIDLTTASGTVTLSWLRQVNDAFPAETYTVYVGTSSDIADLEIAPVSLTEAFTTTPSPTTDTPMTITLDISDLAGEPEVYIAFRHYDCVDADFLSIDDVTVDAESILAVSDQNFSGFNYFVANNQLNLSANTSMEKVALYNMLGQQVVSQKLGNNNEVVELAGLQSGVYIATVSIDGASKSFKIVKN